jgi:hypothetical protein
MFMLPGPQQLLPIKADVTRIIDLDPARIGLLCFSHDHLFVMDVSLISLATFRLDARTASVYRVSTEGSSAMPTRSNAALHDMLPLGNGGWNSLGAAGSE